MKHLRKKDCSGLTLIELMFVVALVSIFSIFLVNLLMASQNSMNVQNTAVPVRAEARLMMETMLKELRAADPSAPGGISIGGSGNSQTITFRIPNQVSSSSVVSWTKVEFYRDSTSKEVRREVDDTTTTVIGHNNEILQFTNPSTNVYKATIQTQKTITGGTDVITANLSSEVKVRN